MAAVIRAVVIIIASAMLASAAPASAQITETTTLPSRCTDQRIAPVSVILSCGSANL